MLTFNIFIFQLGGIVRPNDGNCHMTNNIYTESSNQDYPSVSQIAAKLKEKSISIIFAVTKDQVLVYEKLSQRIESSTTGELANDSSNIVKLIEDNYNVSIPSLIMYLHETLELRIQFL